MRRFPFGCTAINSLLLLASFTILVLPLSDCNDREESFYPSLADAQKDGATIGDGYQTIFFQAP